MQCEGIQATTYARLLSRNQFVLGPRAVPFQDWAEIQIGPGVVVTAHPDLLWCQATHEGTSLTLLGFMLDPANPKRTDQDIVDELIRTQSHQELLDTTNKYGGRWALISSDGMLFTDAAALRQVFYTDRWCASQPGMLAQILGLEVDADARAFIDSLEFRTNRESWWPGDGSLIQGVRHLLPNHVLDLRSATARRFWPYRTDAFALDPLPLDHAVDVIARTLRGLVTSAAHRFDLAVSVTAGWDSRIAVAASRDVAHRITFMTVRQLLMPDDHADVTVPAALLKRLGLQHDVIPATPLVDPDFIRVFKASWPLAHDHYATDADAIFRHYRGHKAILTGTVSEIARHPHKVPLRPQTTDREVGAAWFRTTHPYALREIRRWRDSLEAWHDITPETLFYWEQRCGNWVAMNQLEFDTSWRENVALYNCRGLLIDMFRVPETERNTVLYRRLAEHLWPEVLAEPVNPHKVTSLTTRVKAPLRRLARRLL